MKGAKHVYFMKPVLRPGPIKIGCSTEPEGRLKALHAVSPVFLELIVSTPGHHGYERHLHQMFKATRLHHEWFRPTPALLAIIERIKSGVSLESLFGEVPVRHKPLPKYWAAWLAQQEAAKAKKAIPAGLRVSA